MRHRTTLITGLGLVAVSLAPACLGKLDLGDHADAGAAAAVGAGDPGVAPPPPVATAPVDAGAPSPPPSPLCSTNCTPSFFLDVAGVTALACGSTELYIGTTTGTISRVKYIARTLEEMAPPAPAPIGAMAFDHGTLFYSLPSIGEVHARDVVGGADVRVATAEAAPQGIAIRGDDVLYATRTAVRRVGRVGADQAPTTLVRFVDVSDDAGAPLGPGVGLGVAGSHYVVTHPASDTIALYAATGEELLRQHHFASPEALTMGATLAYYAESDGTIIAHEPVGPSPRWLATKQYLPGGLCLHDGVLYFVTEEEIRYLHVE